MDALDILTLEQCLTSTRKGMLDRAFPQRYARLAAQGLVEKVRRNKEEGYRVTTDGVLFLKRQHQTQMQSKQEKRAREAFED